jgi:hypothetical protein
LNGVHTGTAGPHASLSDVPMSGIGHGGETPRTCWIGCVVVGSVVCWVWLQAAINTANAASFRIRRCDAAGVPSGGG